MSSSKILELQEKLAKLREANAAAEKEQDNWSTSSYGNTDEISTGWSATQDLTSKEPFSRRTNLDNTDGTGSSRLTVLEERLKELRRNNQYQQQEVPLTQKNVIENTTYRDYRKEETLGGALYTGSIHSKEEIVREQTIKNEHYPQDGFSPGEKNVNNQLLQGEWKGNSKSDLSLYERADLIERKMIERTQKEEREKLERCERERLERERYEKERSEREMLEREMLERERLEKERFDRFERERFEKERLEKERFEREMLEREMQERLEKERFERERLERERMERERVERERIKREIMERERIERLERERLERERLDRERLDRERLERERLERERLERERLEREKQMKEMKAKIANLKDRLRSALQEEDEHQHDLEQRMIPRVRQAKELENSIRNEILHIIQQNNLQMDPLPKTRVDIERERKRSIWLSNFGQDFNNKRDKSQSGMFKKKNGQFEEKHKSLRIEDRKYPIRPFTFEEKRNIRKEESRRNSAVSEILEEELPPTVQPSKLLAQVDTSTRSPTYREKEEARQSHVLPTAELSKVVAEKKKKMIRGNSIMLHWIKEMGKPTSKQLFYRDCHPDVQRGFHDDVGFLLIAEEGVQLNASAKTIPLSSIHEIYLGKQTLAFRRHISKKTRDKCCFSFGTMRESFNIECSSGEERDTWVIGIIGLIRSRGKIVCLYRVPLFVKDTGGFRTYSSRGKPIKVKLKVKCKDLPKVGHLLSKRKPLIRLFEKDPETGKYHFLDHTEQAKSGNVFEDYLQKLHNPDFDKELTVDYCPGRNQVICLAVSFHADSDKLKYKYRLGYIDIPIEELIQSYHTDLEYQLKNPQKKSFNKLLKESRTAIIVRCISNVDPQQITEYRQANPVITQEQMNDGFLNQPNNFNDGVNSPNNQNGYIPNNERRDNNSNNQNFSTLPYSNHIHTFRNQTQQKDEMLDKNNRANEVLPYSQPSDYHNYHEENHHVQRGYRNHEYNSEKWKTDSTGSSKSLGKQIQGNVQPVSKNLQKSLQHGQTLLMYREGCHPEKRKFFFKPPVVKHNPGYLYWTELDKEEEHPNSRIELTQIDNMFLGKQTSVLKEAKDVSPQHCLSILARHCLLNLVAEDEKQRDAFAFSLLDIAQNVGHRISLHTC